MQFLSNPERRNQMKRLIVLSAVLALSVAMIPLSRAKGVGTVKKVDPAAGKVTIAHGPIPTMKWPAMSMTFTVKDKRMLGKFSQDKKVEFEFVEQGSNYVITSVK